MQSPDASKNSIQTKPLSLLESIRSGKSLKNVDVEKLKEEQRQFRLNAKETISNMGSLEDTLKKALANRLLDMNLYDGEEDDDIQSWDI